MNGEKTKGIWEIGERARKIMCCGYCFSENNCWFFHIKKKYYSLKECYSCKVSYYLLICYLYIYYKISSYINKKLNYK